MPEVSEIIGDALTVRRAFGEPVEREGVTVIPAAAVRGGGGGGDPEGGGGFGFTARPVGAYVVENGELRWKPAVDPNRIVLGWEIVSLLAVLAFWSVGRRATRG